MKERDKERAVKQVTKAYREYERKSLENDKKFIEELRFNFQYQLDDIIDLFYEDYKPSKYYRNYDLYNVGSSDIAYVDAIPYLEAHLGPENMNNTHRASDKYIYRLSFLDGWHGGARPSEPGGKMPKNDIGGNPFPGSYDQPYYRAGIGLAFWGDPAVNVGYSPRDLFVKSLNESSEAIENKYLEIKNKIYQEYVDAIYEINRKYNMKIEKYMK